MATYTINGTGSDLLIQSSGIQINLREPIKNKPCTDTIYSI